LGSSTSVEGDLLGLAQGDGIDKATPRRQPGHLGQHEAVGGQLQTKVRPRGAARLLIVHWDDLIREADDHIRLAAQAQGGAGQRHVEGAFPLRQAIGAQAAPPLAGPFLLVRLLALLHLERFRPQQRQAIGIEHHPRAVGELFEIGHGKDRPIAQWRRDQFHHHGAPFAAEDAPPITVRAAQSF
jgi:hypothetical protein